MPTAGTPARASGVMCCASERKTATQQRRLNARSAHTCHESPRPDGAMLVRDLPTRHLLQCPRDDETGCSPADACAKGTMIQAKLMKPCIHKRCKLSPWRHMHILSHLQPMLDAISHMRLCQPPRLAPSRNPAQYHGFAGCKAMVRRRLLLSCAIMDTMRRFSVACLCRVSPT